MKMVVYCVEGNTVYLIGRKPYEGIIVKEEWHYDDLTSEQVEDKVGDVFESAEPQRVSCGPRQ